MGINGIDKVLGQVTIPIVENNGIVGASPLLLKFLAGARGLSWQDALKLATLIGCGLLGYKIIKWMWWGNDGSTVSRQVLEGIMKTLETERTKNLILSRRVQDLTDAGRAANERMERLAAGLTRKFQ